jgi:hypothetical protein
MKKHGSKNNQLRFETPEQLQDYLESSNELIFRAYPIVGEPETFHYSREDEEVIREMDGRIFDDLSDFICYAFQCDKEGYAGTEYVNLEILD